MKPEISLHDVHFRYGGRQVLAGVNLEIRAGSCLVVTGPSGEGKSTLVRLAAGLLRPQAGQIRIRTRQIGFVFQEHRLLPWRTALENVMLPLICSREQAREASGRALEAMGLSDSGHLYPAQMSGGMRQRVSLARALAVAPRILFLDEPFTGLDHARRDILKRLLEKNVRGKGIGVVQVTHHAEDVLDGTERVFRLEKGTIQLIEQVVDTHCIGSTGNTEG